MSDFPRAAFHLFVGQRLRRAQVVCVVVVHRRRFAGFRRWFVQRVQVGVVGTVLVPAGHFDAAHGFGVDQGQRHEAVRFKQIIHRLFIAGLEGQYVAVPAVERGLAGLGFGDAMAGSLRQL